MTMNDGVFVWRIINVVATAACLILLSRRYYLFGRTYNQRTLDYWYAMTAWCIVGCGLSLYAMIVEFRPMPILPLVTMAAGISLKGLFGRSEWGGSS